MNNDNNDSLSITVPISLVSEGETKGQVDLKACLEEAEKRFRTYAENFNNRVGKVREAVSKIWDGDMKNEDGTPIVLQHVNHTTLTRMAASVLNKFPSDDNLRELSPLVEQVMTSDNRYCRISLGPNAGYHRLDRYTNEETRNKLIEQASKTIKPRKSRKSTDASSTNA